MSEVGPEAAVTVSAPRNQLPNGNNGHKSFLTISGQGLPRDPHEKMEVILENIREASESLGVF